MSTVEVGGYDIPSVPEEDLKTIVEKISPGELVRFFIDILEQNSEDRVVEVFMAFMASKKPRAPIELNGWKALHQDWTEPYSVQQCQPTSPPRFHQQV